MEQGASSATDTNFAFVAVLTSYARIRGTTVAAVADATPNLA